MTVYASVEDLAARLPGGIDDEDLDRAEAALEDASVLIRAETGMDWASDYPEIVHTVTLWAAMRAMQNPDGVTQEQVGSYSYGLASPSTDVYLTAKERRLVRRAAGLFGVGVQPTSRGDLLETSRDPYWTGDGNAPPSGISSPRTGTQYQAVEPDGEPIPWAGPDGY